MGLIEAAAAALAIYALMHFLALPRLHARLKRAEPGTAAPLVATVLFAEMARGATLVIALSLGLVVTAIWSTPLVLAHGSQAQLGAAFGFLRHFRELLDSIEVWWGIATIIVLALALRFALRREAALRARKATEAAFEKFKSDAEAGNLADLPPTEEMRRLADTIEQRRARAIAIVEAAQAEGGDATKADPNANPELATLLREIDALREEFSRLDIIRRLDLATPLDDLARPAETRLGRIGSFFLGAGVIGSLSAGARTLSIASLALLAPALVAVASEGLSEASLEASVRVHDLILQDKIKDAEESWHHALERAEQDRQLTGDDNALIDALAEQFQQFVQTQNARLYQAAFRSGHELGRNLVREQILREFADQHPGKVKVKGAAEEVQNAPGMKAVLAAQPSESAPPSTVREQFRAELAREARQATPRSWNAFRARAREAIASARAPLSSGDIAERLFTEAINSAGSALTGAGNDSRAFHLLASAVVEPGDLAERSAALLKLDRLEFLNGILQRGVIGTPPTALAPEHGVPLRDERGATRAESVARNVGQHLDASAEPWRHAPPSLQLAEDGRDFRAAREQLLALAGRNLPRRVEIGLPNALATFGDYFPGSYGEETRTPRAAMMESSPAFKPAVDRRPIARSENFLRARNYAALRGFAKVGGVLLGLEPERDQDAPQIVGLRWTESSAGVRLFLERDDGRTLPFGPFRAAIIRLALAYAADGRPIAATMPAAGPYGRQVLLHPALVDSAIGCEARHIDQFVDTFTARAEPRRTASELVGQHGITYTFGWAAQIARIAPEVIDQAHPDDRQPLRELIAEADDILGAEPVGKAVEATLADPASWKNPQLSPVTVKHDYFDRTLVSTITGCLPQARDAAGLRQCVATAQRDEAYVRSYAWALPPPTFFPESGVRERPYSLDRELSFLDLSRQRDDPAWPFDFMLQVTFESPRYFAPERQSVTFDEAPFEFPALHEWIHREVTQGIRAGAFPALDAARILADMREFTVLQRFFRLALAGRLGEHFPVERLVKLGRVEPRGPLVPIRTLRWNSPNEVIASFKGKPIGAPLASLGILADAQQLATKGDRCPVIEP